MNPASYRVLDCKNCKMAFIDSSIGCPRCFEKTKAQYRKEPAEHISLEETYSRPKVKRGYKRG